MTELTEGLAITDIKVDERVRKEMGDIDELANSIRSVGLIQPIVVTRDNKLVAGERRLRALKSIGINVLVHAHTFIYNDEVDELKIKAMECEENIKRKGFTWQEEVIAKKRLLDLMQQIHGVSRPGHPGRDTALGITSSGFGINKLANLLGESNAQTSKDIELANLITQVPEIAKAETKEAARRQVLLALTVAGALQQQAKNPPKTDKKWTLYEGDFTVESEKLEDNSCDAVIVDPPYGEDSQGMGPQSKQLLAEAFTDGLAPTRDLYIHLARCSWRVLRNDRFAAFFFGFALYPDFVSTLRDAGFSVDLTPLIWVKNTVINTSPYSRYGRSYEPILLVRKGEPKLMRPSQRDVIIVDNVITRGTNEQKLYQAQKPVALIEKLILDLSPPGATVVDFCAGSGTTGEAGLRQGRRVVLFEKDPVACQIIRARLGSL